MSNKRKEMETAFEPPLSSEKRAAVPRRQPSYLDASLSPTPAASTMVSQSAANALRPRVLIPDTLLSPTVAPTASSGVLHEPSVQFFAKRRRILQRMLVKLEREKEEFLQEHETQGDIALNTHNEFWLKEEVCILRLKEVEQAKVELQHLEDSLETVKAEKRAAQKANHTAVEQRKVLKANMKECDLEMEKISDELLEIDAEEAEMKKISDELLEIDAEEAAATNADTFDWKTADFPEMRFELLRFMKNKKMIDANVDVQELSFFFLLQHHPRKLIPLWEEMRQGSFRENPHCKGDHWSTQNGQEGKLTGVKGKKASELATLFAGAFDLPDGLPYGEE